MRTEKRVKAFFWGCVFALPLIIACLSVFRTGEYADFSTIVNGFTFDFINQALSGLENATQFTFNACLKSIVSYFVSVEILQIFYEVVVFIPQFARKWLEGFYAN